jgi:hypothetical protein
MVEIICNFFKKNKKTPRNICKIWILEENNRRQMFTNNFTKEKWIMIWNIINLPNII